MECQCDLTVKDPSVVTLSTRRKAHCCNLVYNGLNGKPIKGINNILSMLSQSSGRTTRASNNEKPAKNLQISKANFKYRGLIYYNHLLLEVKKALSLESFKKRVMQI